MRKTASVLALLASSIGCMGGASEDTDSGDGAIQEDTHRAPQRVKVPVRFTQNTPDDVGFAFTSSWIPFTNVKKEKLDGYLFGFTSPSDVEKIEAFTKPDMPGAGYATAWFDVEVPYDTDGKLAVGLSRVKLESQFLKTEMLSGIARKYSPMRVRSGSDQPCLSVTMAGGLDGKFKSVPLPFTDDGFTEHAWKVGDVDAEGVPIKNVLVGTLQFTGYCWPENVEGKTGVSAGVATPGLPAFLMVDKGSGTGDGGHATLYVNLVENEKGKVSIGDVFSTNGGILNARDLKAFDDATAAFAKQFAADARRGTEDKLKTPPPIGP
jgi:hypothetical protein